MSNEAIRESRPPDPLKVALMLISRWYWIAGSLAGALMIASVYLWTTTTMYSASLYIKYEESQNDLSNLSGIVPVRAYTSKIMSESILIRRRGLLRNALRHMDWKVSYFSESPLGRTETYPLVPFQIRILRQDVPFFTGAIRAEFSGDTYSLSYTDNGIAQDRTCRYDLPIQLPGLTFCISKPGRSSSGYTFRFNTVPALVSRLISGLSLTETSRFSGMAVLSKTDPNPVFAADAVNAIAREYLANDLLQKKRSMAQIIRFIDDQLPDLSGKVDAAGYALELYRKHADARDQGLPSGQISGIVSSAKMKVDLLRLQLAAIERSEHRLRTGSDSSVNFLRDLNEPALNEMADRFNQLAIRKQQAGATFRKGAGSFISLEAERIALTRSTEEVIQAVKQELTAELLFNTAQLRSGLDNLAGLPAKEQQVEQLSREYGSAQKIFNFLQEKKLEIGIGKASILPGIILVEPATPNHYPIAPAAKSVWRSAVVLGILTGIAAIVAVRAFNPFVHTAADISKHTKMPVLGTICRDSRSSFSPGNALPVLAHASSPAFIESVKRVRNDLSLHITKESTVVAVTSHHPGAGKSFVAAHLATGFAAIHKKIVLIDANLRQPFSGRSNSPGLSSILTRSHSIEECITKTRITGLDLITAGPAAANCDELFYQPAWTDLLAHLKGRYAIVFIDAASIGTAAEPAEIIRKSDLTIHVLRAGKSLKGPPSLPASVNGAGECRSMIVLNGTYEDALFGAVRR